MLACSFGCDVLYESGWITVDQNGDVQTVPQDGMLEGRVREHLRQLTGRRCAAHTSASAAYFAWHHKTIFRGRDASISPD